MRVSIIQNNPQENLRQALQQAEILVRRAAEVWYVPGLVDT